MTTIDMPKANIEEVLEMMGQILERQQTIERVLSDRLKPNGDIAALKEFRPERDAYDVFGKTVKDEQGYIAPNIAAANDIFDIEIINRTKKGELFKVIPKVKSTVIVSSYEDGKTGVMTLGHPDGLVTIIEQLKPIRKKLAETMMQTMQNPPDSFLT